MVFVPVVSEHFAVLDFELCGVEYLSAFQALPLSVGLVGVMVVYGIHNAQSNGFTIRAGHWGVSFSGTRYIVSIALHMPIMFVRLFLELIMTEWIGLPSS